MARLTYDEFIDTITNFVWNNLNKEITGPVLRQFIVNILHSTTEMKLKDERTIEKAIADIESAINNLKNNVTVGDSDGGSSTIQFSEQFKNISDEIWMNLALITADSEEESSGDDSGGDLTEPDVYAVSIFDNDTFPQSIVRRAPNAVIGVDLIVGWNDAAGSYVLEFVNDVELVQEFDNDLRKLSILNFDLEKIGYYDLQYESGETIEFNAKVRANQTFLNSINASINDTWFYPLFWAYPTGSMEPDEFTSFSNMSPDTWYPIIQTQGWYYDMFEYILFRFYTYSITFQAGSKFEIKDIVLKRW